MADKTNITTEEEKFQEAFRRFKALADQQQEVLDTEIVSLFS